MSGLPPPSKMNLTTSAMFPVPADLPPTPEASPAPDLSISKAALFPATPSYRDTFLASSLVRSPTTLPRHVPASEAAAGASPQTICTDHMITVSWSASAGWAAPHLRPYGPLSLMPTASVLHYATECFEGLKAYRGHDGRLRLFRPDCNARRFRDSARRISLPTFEPRELERLLVELLATDGPKWLPRDWRGSFLYVRPTLIGTAAALGVAAPREALLFIVLAYLPRLDSPPAGMWLHTSADDAVRAWAGGCGSAKVGANYGPTLQATREVHDRGFHQVLWLYGPDRFCTEAGASNMFVAMRPRASRGRVEVVTAPLDDRLILDGVTRRSVLALLRQRLAGAVDVSERRYTIAEVMEAWAEGRLVEAFAAGTAYFICPISLIHHRGCDIEIPMGENGKMGAITAQVRTWMADIMYGGVEHEWGVVIPEEEEEEREEEEEKEKKA